MATAGYADFNVDPATGLKRRIMQSLDPNATAADPSAPSPSAAATPDAAPFVNTQPYARADQVGDQPPDPAPYVPPPAATPDPAPTATPAAAPAPAHDPNNRNDEGYIDSVVSQWMQGNNPQGHQDAAYWKRRILETGGLGADNLGYWQGRFTEAPGTHQEGPAAGAPAVAARPADDTYSKFLEQLTNERAAAAAQRDQVRQMIMDRLKAAGQPVNENDIGISQPLAAARDEVQRSQQTERTALAERLYAQGSGGLNSNALTQGIQQSAERNAGGLSQLRAGLITEQYKQKATELQGLLQMALASGDTQSAQLLQAEIASLSASVQREGIGVNLAEFLANLNSKTALAGAGG